MARPKYTKQDGNQNDIENQLLELGFKTLRVSNMTKDTNSDVHPLDLFVLGLHRKLNVPVWSQWEIKVRDASEFTDSEIKWLAQSKWLFGEDVPVLVAYDVDDVLKWYGWT